MGHPAAEAAHACPSHQDLVARLALGDEAAEEEFVRRFSDRIVTMMRVRTRDKGVADDLAQEVLVESLKALRRGAIAAPERLGAFVHGTALNVLNNYLRARGRRPAEIPLPDDIPDPRSAADPAAARDALALARRALARLSPRDQDLIRMSLVEGMTSAEIAAALGLGVELARVRKCRTLKKFLRAFEKLSRRGARSPLCV